MVLPRGVRYEPKHPTVEVQVFPEEYFSGSDVSVYFGDLWIDDITSISFEMMEAVRPIMGYASYTWDTVVRGARQIQGHFSIAFRESGYLNNLVLDHIAQMKHPKPAVAHLMDQDNHTGPDGEYIPPWSARARERVEGLLARYHAPVRSTRVEEREVIPTWPDIRPGLAAPEWALRELAEALFRKKDPDGLPYLGDYDPAQSYRLYDQAMQDAVVRLQEDMPWPKDENGVVGTYTKQSLAFKRLERVTEYDLNKSLSGGAPNIQQMAKSRTARYEAEVWGLDGATYRDGAAIQEIPLRAMRRFRPHWYSGTSDPDTGAMGTEVLQERGFDVYFSFGALDGYVAQQGRQASNTTFNRPRPGDITFPSTVRALRNVQITGLGMALDASGRPVEEIYRFIAQDLD